MRLLTLILFAVPCLDSAMVPLRAAAEGRPVDLRAVLDQRIEGTLIEIPLEVVLKFLEDETGQMIAIDKDVRDKMPTVFEEPVTLRWNGTKSVRAIAAYALDPYDLALAPSARYESLIVTHVESQPMLTRMYDLTDLAFVGAAQGVGVVQPIADGTGDANIQFEEEPDGYFEPEPLPYSRAPTQPELMYLDAGGFVTLILNQTSGPWQDIIGEGGTIDSVVSHQRLVLSVTAYDSMHCEIEHLLARLRTAYRLPQPAEPSTPAAD